MAMAGTCGFVADLLGRIFLDQRSQKVPIENGAVPGRLFVGGGGGGGVASCAMTAVEDRRR